MEELSVVVIARLSAGGTIAKVRRLSPNKSEGMSKKTTSMPANGEK